ATDLTVTNPHPDDHGPSPTCPRNMTCLRLATRRNEKLDPVHREPDDTTCAAGSPLAQLASCCFVFITSEISRQILATGRSHWDHTLFLLSPSSLRFPTSFFQLLHL